MKPCYSLISTNDNLNYTNDMHDYINLTIFNVKEFKVTRTTDLKNNRSSYFSSKPLFWIAFWFVQGLLMGGGKEVGFFLVKGIAIVGMQFFLVQLNLKYLIPYFFDKGKYLQYSIYSISLVYVVFTFSFNVIGLVFSLYYYQQEFNVGEISFVTDFWRIISGSALYSLAYVGGLIYYLISQRNKVELIVAEAPNPKIIALPQVRIKDGHDLHLVKMDEVLFVQGMKEYVKWETTSKAYMELKSLKKIEEEYREIGMLRVHKSYIVNKNHIDSLGSNFLNIREYKIPVGRTYKDKVKGMLE